MPYMIKTGLVTTKLLFCGNISLTDGMLGNFCELKYKRKIEEIKPMNAKNKKA